MKIIKFIVAICTILGITLSHSEFKNLSSGLLALGFGFIFSHLKD